MTASEFFDLEGYLHFPLFEEIRYVWEALNHLESYLEQQILGKIEGAISEEAHLVNPGLISIGKGARVEAGACIEGPAIIGSDCVVRHGAYVRGGVVMGRGCVVGHASEVKHSIFLNEVVVPHFNYVGDSILGNRVHLGAGATCANLRLDLQAVKVFYNGKKVNTGLVKLGAILGDGVQLGCNSVLNPGTLMGKESVCYPCLNIGGVIAPHTMVKR